MLRRQVLLIVFLGVVYAKEGFRTIRCEEGRVQARCNKVCCEVNETEIMAGGSACNQTVEDTLKKHGEVRCPNPRGCDPGLNSTDIRVLVSHREKDTWAGQNVSFTYNAYAMSGLLNCTWTHDGSPLRSKDRTSVITKFSNATLHFCDSLQKVVGLAATLTIHDVGFEDDGRFASTICSPARCVTTTFTLHVSAETLPPSVSTPVSTAATPSVPADDHPDSLSPPIVIVIVVVVAVGGIIVWVVRHIVKARKIRRRTRCTDLIPCMN